MSNSGDTLKKQAAEIALTYVKSGMVIGLGTGSTTKYFTEMLGDRLQKRTLRNIIAVPTSENTVILAHELGISLGNLDDHEVLDVAVDGADEVDPDLNLIKGLGKALLREKIVEIHAKHFIVVVDESKMVERLGTHGSLPIEIAQFGAGAHVRWLQTLGCEAELWLKKNGQPEVSDNGNYLARCTFKGGIPDAHKLAETLDKRSGIVEHGLFLDMAHTVIIGTEHGSKIKKKN